MTFDSDLQEVEQPQKVHAVEFNVRGVITRYTSSRSNVVVAGNVFRPARLRVDISKLTNKTIRKNIEIDTSLDEISLGFAANSVPANISVIVMEIFVETLTCRTIFVGALSRVTLTSPRTAKLICESSTNGFRNKLPTYSHSSDCGNNLFDENCKVLEADYETPLIVSSISPNGAILTSSDLSNPVFPANCTPTVDQLIDWFVEGFVLLNDETDIRMITDYNNNQITIQFPFDSRVTVGSVLKAFPGCRKDARTCNDKFCNKQNNRAFPYVPITNPILFGIDKG